MLSITGAIKKQQSVHCAAIFSPEIINLCSDYCIIILINDYRIFTKSHLYIGQVQFGSPLNFLNPIISKLDKHVVLLPINYRASKNSLFKAKLNIRAKTIQFLF